MEINHYIVLVCLAFAVFLIVKEIKRLDKSRLFLRLIASLVMLACFALLIVPIRYTIKKDELPRELNLFTEKPNHFTDLNYYLKEHPEIKKINIYGYGLNLEELKRLKGYQLSFHPSVIPSGFISASWPKKIKATEQLRVQGIYRNAKGSAVKVKLLGFGTTLDSIIVKANNKANFSFSNYPKQLGKAVFSLIALQGNDTLAIEPVPFEVEPKEPFSVLILASFPDFEYKFLKRWLFENQFQVAFRSQISKNKYTNEFLNRKAIGLNQINQDLLKDIDVAIIDEEELTPQLQSAVHTGMGLIVRTKAIKSAQDHEALKIDTTGKVSVDRRLSGSGKIITTTLASTFQWQLAGKQADYSEFWSLLFNKALRKKIKNYTYNIEQQWPTVNEKVRLTLSQSDNQVPIFSIDGNIIAPKQNIELPFAWEGSFFSSTEGWVTLFINQKKENIYIYHKTDWNVAKNVKKLEATENFIANQSEKTFKTTKINYLATEQLSKWWFFAAFLIAVSFLWYEQRFLESK